MKLKRSGVLNLVLGLLFFSFLASHLRATEEEYLPEGDLPLEEEYPSDIDPEMLPPVPPLPEESDEEPPLEESPLEEPQNDSY